MRLLQAYASKCVEVRVAYLNLDPGATCKVSDGAASGGKQEMLSMGQKIRNSWSGEPGCSYADEGRGDNGIQRASKKFNISRSREFIATICHSSSSNVGTTHLWCLQGSTAGSKLCSDSICAKGAAMWCLLVLRIFWELSSWKLQFEHVNLSVRFEQCVAHRLARLPSWATRGISTCQFHSIPNTCPWQCARLTDSRTARNHES